MLSSLDAEPQTFFDPNLLSADGTIALSNTAFSEDGKYFAYGLSESGSDWVKIRVRNVESGKDLDEELVHCKFTGISFTHDNLGFFYSRYPEKEDMQTESDAYHKLFYHRLNTPQSDDVAVVQFPDEPKYRVSGTVSDCGRYLNVFVSQTCDENLWFFVDLQDYPEIKGEFSIKPLVAQYDAEYDYITNDDNLFYFRTNKNAPNFRIAMLDIHNPKPENWKDIVPEHDKDVLDSAQCVHGDNLVVIYIRDVINIIELHELKSGKFVRQIDIPIGTIVSFSGRRKQSEVFFYLTSFLTPGIMYHYDFNKHDVPQVSYFRSTIISPLTTEFN
jgi:prolyl oligopeptidase